MMNKQAYLDGYSPSSLEGIKGNALDLIHPSATTLAKHTGGRVKDWVQSNPNKVAMLLGIVGGGIAGGAMGKKKFMPVNRPTKEPILKGMAVGGAATAGALAYSNRDKIAEFFKNLKKTV